MEYLVLAGSDLRESLSRTLGEHAPFFWNVAAPVGLAIVWLGSVYTLWQIWSQSALSDGGGGGLILRLVFSVVSVLAILLSGTGIEYLLLGDGHLHSQLLAGLLGIFHHA